MEEMQAPTKTDVLDQTLNKKKGSQDGEEEEKENRDTEPDE